MRAWARRLWLRARLWVIDRRIKRVLRRAGERKSLTVASMNSILRDHYPLPGARLKQYVVEERREQEWARQTCPCVIVSEHLDDEGAPCSKAGLVQWTTLHDCACQACNDIADEAAHPALGDPRVLRWLAERAARPPITADREALSDEIAPDWSGLAENPFVLAIRSRKPPGAA
jgi:hypothetical protein